MPKGKIRFGYWFFRLVFWDSLLPAVVVLVPMLIQSLFPNRRGPIEIAGLLVPMVAFFIRLLAGKRHIAANHCSPRFRGLQVGSLVFGLFWLAVIDAFVVLSHIIPAGAMAFTTSEVIIVASLYLPPMAFAMYPGRAWSSESIDPGALAPQKMIEHIRAAIGSAPRHLSWWRRLTLWTPRMAWVRPSYGLYEVYRRRQQLLEEGEVVWGALVEFHSQLLKPTMGDLSAVVIYAPDQSLDNFPQWLLALAHCLGQRTDTSATPINEQITNKQGATDQQPAIDFNDTGPSIATTIPSSITHGRTIRCAQFMVFRSHLPDSIIRAPCIPLLIHPSTPAVMIVPYQFWPESFSRQWKESSLSSAIA